MLTDLLRTLADGRAGSLAELASLLGTDDRGLLVALAHCQRLGYLEPADAGCTTGATGSPSACGGCPVAGACLPAGEPGRGLRASPDRSPGRSVSVAPTWWRLTERGHRAVGISLPTQPSSG